MKEVIISGKASGIYWINLEDASDNACWDRILLDDECRAAGRDHCHTVRAGDLLIYDLHNGRGVCSMAGSSILFQPSVDPAVWAGLCGISGDPSRCPYCGGDGVRHAETSTALELEAWECHGTCKGRRFWV